MPSATVNQLQTAVRPETPIVWSIYNGDVYAVRFDADTIHIIKFTDGSVKNISTGITDAIHPDTRLIDYKFINRKTVNTRLLVIESGKLTLLNAEVDLDALTGQATVESSLSLSWISKAEEITHSMVIPPYLWIAPNEEDSAVHYVNIDDGNDVSFDAGFNGNFARPSVKYMHFNDDIYMLLGVHNAGANAYQLKVYSKTVTDTGVSGGGGSPRTQIGAPTLFYDDIIFPCGWGGVSGSNNNIVLFDKRITSLGTIDLGTLTGWSDVDTMPGFTIFAKKSDGNYYALLAVRHSTGSSSPEGRLYFLELKRDGTIVDSSLLHSFSMDDGDKFRVSIKPDYSDWATVPLIDIDKKLLYALAWDVESSTNKAYAITVDLSDVWDNIAELNKAVWLGSGSRIPTILTLTII